MSLYKDSLCKTYLRKASLYRTRLAAVTFAMSLMATGCGGTAFSDNSGGVVTGALGTMGLTKESEENGESMETGKSMGTGEAKENREADHESESVCGDELKDGAYPVAVESSSNVFRIIERELTVKDGSMSAVMTMGGTGYSKLYAGTGEEAQKASDQDFIPYVEIKDGVYTFTVPVAALDQKIDCSAFSKSKKKWYDRALVFRLQSLPLDVFTDSKITTVESLKLEDGSYTVEVKLEGDLDWAAVKSPIVLRAEDGKVLATITWGSSNYDCMGVGEEKFELINMEGNPVFEIPVNNFDWKIPVIVDIIAVSQSHEISHTLIFGSPTLKRAER